jgi:hypothetical protein
LALLLVAPLTLFYIYSPFQAPGLEFAFIAIVLTSQIFLTKDKEYKKRYKTQATQELKKELGKQPSYEQINNRLDLYLHYKNVTAYGISFIIYIISITLK